MYGILQPLTVTRKEIEREDGTFYTEYELIAGERRLRASKLAGLAQVPVIIREGEESEQEKLELAIIENLQREDLNSIDRALAFRQLSEVFGLSHSQVAKKVGRSREYVSNTIRLLALPDYMQSALKQGEISEGHGRTLLMLSDRPEEQDVVFREILLKKLSVREVERIVRKIATDKVRKKESDDFDTELIEIEKRFMETLGTRVQIQKTDYGGRLTIDYFSVTDLEEMLTRMKTDGVVLGPSSGVVKEQAQILDNHTPLDLTNVAPLIAAAPAAGEFLQEVLSERREQEVMTETDDTLLSDKQPVEEKSAVAMPFMIMPPVENSLINAPVVPPNTNASSQMAVFENESLPLAVANPVEENVTQTAVVPTEDIVSKAASDDLAKNDNSTNTPPSAKPPEEDDGDLYSIRNFTV